MNGLADGGRDWEGILMVNIKKTQIQLSTLYRGLISLVDEYSVENEALFTVTKPEWRKYLCLSIITPAFSGNCCYHVLPQESAKLQGDICEV